MNTKPQLLPDDLVSCEICMKEIPVSEAKSDEASDYVVFYYGLDCYKVWSEQTRTVNTIHPDSD